MRKLWFVVPLAAALLAGGCTDDVGEKPKKPSSSAEAGISDATLEQWARQWDDVRKERKRALKAEETTMCVGEADSWWYMSGLSDPGAPDLIAFGDSWDEMVPCDTEQALVVVDIDTGEPVKGADLFSDFQ